MNPEVTPKGAEKHLRNSLSKSDKVYVSVRPGYTLTLPEGLALNTGKTRIVFDSRQGKEFRTKEIPIQKYLEEHPKFGRPGLPNENESTTEFYYSPSAEELAAEKAAEEARKQINFIKSTPGLTLDLKDYNKTALVQLAIKLNVPVVVDGKDRSVDALRKDIVKLFDEEPKKEE